jgi:hypothetical protein
MLKRGGTDISYNYALKSYYPVVIGNNPYN